jgi:uncharacterized membrane protein
MIKAEWFYWLCGVMFLFGAVLTLRDRANSKRHGSAAFWALLGISFMYGTFVANKTAPAWILGLVVIGMTVLVGTRQLATGTLGSATIAEKTAAAARFGNRLFIPPLIIPVGAVIFGVVLAKVHLGSQPLLETGMNTLIGLGVASIVAVVVGVMMLRPKSPLTPLTDGHRLLEVIGWTALLPQMLATLGSLFNVAGVGHAVGTITKAILPSGSLLGSVVVYCVGMVVFTVIMGNAFAAFPIMTAAIGYPVLVQNFHGNVAAVFAIGMLAGYCGTLTTPMAANYNLVPVALLDMKSRYGVIKAQIPTAIPLLFCNIGLMYFIAFGVLK